MKLEFLDNKDFWAGVMLIVTGAAAIYIARNYSFGTSLRMGPGYFPTVLGGMLILFGFYLVGSGLGSGGEKLVSSWSLRALIILPLSLVLFGVLIDPPAIIRAYTPGGFVPAMMVLIFGSATATTEFNFVEVLLFSIFLTVLSVAVFIWGLGLPYPLFSDFG
jgi:hypothetical protein